jgi:taurine dioxygenase
MPYESVRLTPALGAQVLGLDLTGDPTELAPVMIDDLRRHQVLMFRNADLSAPELAALGRAMGTLGQRHHSYGVHPDADDVVVLDWDSSRPPDGAEWHADMTYKPHPPYATLLLAVQVPPLGGDTLFASLTSVYDALSPGLQADLAHLEAVHDPGTFRTTAYLDGGDAAIGSMLSAAGSAVHPVIATNPLTGAKYLNVSEAFTRSVIGLSAAESARLLTMLFDLINRPEHHVRLRWEPNTLVIWDNRGTQHYAVDDYLPHRRVMHRVVVAEAGAAPI